MAIESGMVQGSKIEVCRVAAVNHGACLQCTHALSNVAIASKHQQPLVQLHDALNIVIIVMQHIIQCVGPPLRKRV